MKAISFKRHRFPADVFQYALCLYFRFTLSFSDVEELLAERRRCQLRDEQTGDHQVRTAGSQEAEVSTAGVFAAVASR